MIESSSLTMNLTTTFFKADHPNELNSSRFLCIMPHNALKDAGFTSYLFDLDEYDTSFAQHACKNSDTIIYERNLVGPIISEIKKWREAGKRVIITFDDAYNLMPITTPSYQYWQKGIRPDGVVVSPAPINQFKMGLRLASAATCPSRKLAEDWSDYTKTYYLQNHIEVDAYKVKREERDTINIGWGGSITHYHSFVESGLPIALKNVCHKRKQVKILVAGDPRIFNSIPVPESQKEHIRWVLHQYWPQNLSKFDIAISPMSGAYDHRRSYIKALEYMIMKIPWVASRGSAYDEVAGFGTLVENNPKAWEKALLKIVDNYTEYKLRAACQPYEFALRHDIHENLDRYIGIYTR